MNKHYLGLQLFMLLFVVFPLFTYILVHSGSLKVALFGAVICFISVFCQCTLLLVCNECKWVCRVVAAIQLFSIIVASRTPTFNDAVVEAIAMTMVVMPILLIGCRCFGDKLVGVED